MDIVERQRKIAYTSENNQHEEKLLEVRSKEVIFLCFRSNFFARPSVVCTETARSLKLNINLT